MRFIIGRAGRRLVRFSRRFLHRDEGAVAIYVTLVAVVMLGFGALVVDLGRIFTYQTELQKAVDASALAAAAELDGTAGAISRARMAAKDTLVNNRQTFGEGGPEVDFTDSDIRFLHSLPASDDTPIDSSYVTTDDSAARFVEVRASARTIGFFLAPVLAHRIGGGGPEVTEGETSAVAVAGFNQVVCNFPPLMICNPAEAGGNTGAEFTAVDGELIKLKEGGGSGQWGPGNFGLLDPAQGNQGTAEVQENLASASPTGCFNTTVDLRTGNAQHPVSTAINVRFDMYENPGFGGNAKNNSDYRPSVNVTKGKYKSGNSFEDYPNPPDPPNGMGMPKHECLEADNCDTAEGTQHPRFAPPPGPDQQIFWQEYWDINHPPSKGHGTFLSNLTALDANQDGIVTRLEMYNWEIDNDAYVENVNDAENDHSDINGENGHPMHYGGAASPDRERRVMPVAVINCVEHGPINGNTDNVPVKAFAKMFLTNPAESGGSGEQTIFAEVTGVLQPGVDDVLHDVVQLYR